jgi:hypothetical protein
MFFEEAYRNRGIRPSSLIKPQIASLRSCISGLRPASKEGNWMRTCPAIVRGFFVVPAATPLFLGRGQSLAGREGNAALRRPRGQGAPALARQIPVTLPDAGGTCETRGVFFGGKSKGVTCTVRLPVRLRDLTKRAANFFRGVFNQPTAGAGFKEGWVFLLMPRSGSPIESRLLRLSPYYPASATI